jgi:hypothetical protein
VSKKTWDGCPLSGQRAAFVTITRPVTGQAAREFQINLFDATIQLRSDGFLRESRGTKGNQITYEQRKALRQDQPIRLE